MTETHALADLLRLDAAMAAKPQGQRSLSPKRNCATPLVELASLESNVDERPVFAEALGTIAAATVENFPDNIFWDFDRLAQVLASADAAARTRLTRLVVALNRRFGRNSVIAFRYAHDFLYGFDWARWVKKEPEARCELGPFTEAFLTSMEHRGRDLERLIAANDTKYPQLPAGAARNPFEFSREPDDEYRLLRLLAERGHIPVPAWERAARLDYRVPYTQLREQTARELGLTQPRALGGAGSAIASE